MLQTMLRFDEARRRATPAAVEVVRCPRTTTLPWFRVV
jgi:hypothetical protein